MSSLPRAITIAGLALVAAMTVVAAQPPPSTQGIGHVDGPESEVLTEPFNLFRGWALSRSGIERVDVVVDDRQRFPARLGVARADVQAAHPDFPDSTAAGFEVKLDFSALPIGHHEVTVVATDKAGVATTLGRRTYLFDAFQWYWAGLLAARGRRPNDVFHFVLATSGLEKGGGAGIDTDYRPYVSDTVRVGVRVPILYMRTTKGRAQDWSFDPDFDTALMCGKRVIAEDTLSGVVRWSIAHKVPVLFTLNGGIWADAACDVPEWDINDQLEQDVANCQWNERNEVMPDDYLRHLPGSQDAPELARVLTFHVHAASVRQYKRRNLQQAAAIIRRFADQHPDLFIGVSLDPDIYMNPFFEGAQWYDYNPGTLRQFREWLRGTGPYAGGGEPVVPDLSAYRRKTPLTLTQVNKLAKARFETWGQVDPPRLFKPEATMLKTPWAAVWEQFRRHLVDLHYDDLSRWVAETGIDPNQIFSSQGFNAPGTVIEPFPLRIDSPPKNYDTGGMSVQGAVPSHGHLGAILYGEAAVDNIRMEGKDSLFRVFRDFDTNWAVIEYNTADVRQPKTLPDFARAYRGLRDIANFGARFVSPMAWNGSPGSMAADPGFVSYTSYRAAPLEAAVRSMMVNRANLPRQARLWGFGFGVAPDDDGWKALAPASAAAWKAGLQVMLKRGRARLDSPPNLDFRTNELDALVIALAEPAADLRIEVHARQRDKTMWRRITGRSVISAQRTRAGYVVSLPHSSRQFEQVRLVLTSPTRGGITVERIALYPVARGR
ncbi:MAG: hypothetical protein ABI831_06775 [Betaproteobacteria bacterium]